MADLFMCGLLLQVRYALKRSGRCLVADEMGTGKTVQALGIMSCYREEWPVLVLVPASMRLVWAEAAERWLPHVRPSNIHVIMGNKDAMLNDPNNRPSILITSYEMAR